MKSIKWYSIFLLPFVLFLSGCQEKQADSFLPLSSVQTAASFGDTLYFRSMDDALYLWKDGTAVLLKDDFWGYDMHADKGGVYYAENSVDAAENPTVGLFYYSLRSKTAEKLMDAGTLPELNPFSEINAWRDGEDICICAKKKDGQYALWLLTGKGTFSSVVKLPSDVSSLRYRYGNKIIYSSDSAVWSFDYRTGETSLLAEDASSVGYCGDCLILYQSRTEDGQFLYESVDLSTGERIPFTESQAIWTANDSFTVLKAENNTYIYTLRENEREFLTIQCGGEDLLLGSYQNLLLRPVLTDHFFCFYEYAPNESINPPFAVETGSLFSMKLAENGGYNYCLQLKNN